MSTKPNILYVDDEPNNLTGFKASFRRDYKIFTAESAEEAMELLKEEDFEVIISDQRMPGMSGVEFFEAIKDDYPQPVRMLLTGYSDIESVIKAINEGNVYRYITKPWEEQDLKLTIDNALEFYKAKNDLRQRNIELEKAYNELEKFVYSASHDLRAPLASVLGIVRLAKMENKNPDFEDYLDKIETSIDKLDIFIQNIIAYYRSEKLEVQSTEIDFEELISNAIQSLEHYENATAIDISMEIKQNEIFKCDESRLKLIVNNLLSNAIRYQRPEESNKRIDIRVSVEQNMATIKVEDNGIGIKPVDIRNIYNMFYTTASANSGSGIGLYIVKDTLKKLSGSIEVDSTAGKGTTFIIKIPGQK
ncbi:MAG: hybrid sensor histidine kinase/response regulator [Chitinophagales bacterium]